MSFDRLKRPGVLAATVGLGALVALGAGFGGVTWLLNRPDPSPTPAAAVATASPTPTPTPLSGPIVIHGTGDVNLDIGQLGLLRTSFDAPWTGVRDLFVSDDLTVVNLECAAGEGGAKQDKQYTFRCHHPAYAAMRSAGVEVANQANNHSMDFGPEPMLDGKVRLRAADVVAVGLGANAAEANAAFVFEIKGKKVAVLGFSAVVPSPSWLAGASHAGLANGYDIANLKSSVQAADEQADFVVATIHMGEEGHTSPRSADIARAHALVDAGADVVFGHHAHVLQPLEFYKGRPIFFGLGNFVWPRNGPTAVGEVTLFPDGRVGACLLPAGISGGRPSLNDPSARCP
ncbi:MAG: CapA family protein [Actinomycetota bacterium]